MTSVIFKQVQNKRKQWNPISPTTNEYAIEGAEDTINRCLALRLLELPVKDLILDGLSKIEKGLIGKLGVETLLRNTLDEDKHDTALNNIVKVYPDYDSKLENEAKIILKAWLSHIDFPITKVAVLENGVFFVILPIYRFLGGSALRKTAFDISADEVNHVQSHKEAAKLTNNRPSKSLDQLRKDTVAWLLQNLNLKSYTKDKFMKASDDLMYRGITDELNFTQTYSQIAFFETRNTNLPTYS